MSVHARRFPSISVVAVAAVYVGGRAVHAQSTPVAPAVTRLAAISSAVSRSPRATLAAADTASAAANVFIARQWENPVLSASVSKSAPQQHYSLDVPLDPWWIRSPRIAAAEASRTAARLRYAFATRNIALDADTAYTRAQLTSGRSRLSTRTARDADSLMVLARIRHDAGDASALDVELASVFAGQARNGASADSIAAMTAVLTLQTIMGVSADSAAITIADSLTLEPLTLPSSAASTIASQSLTAGAPLLIDAATRDVTAAEGRVLTERRRRFGAPSLTLGVESVNPGGPGGPLALTGLSFPLPLFNRNDAAVMSARAELTRAEAQLALTRLATSAAVVSTRRDAAAARARALRSAQLVASADRIASLSLLAYREGASTLVLVLDAQRTARETLGQYLDDVAAARIASSLLRLLTSPVPDSRP